MILPVNFRCLIYVCVCWTDPVAFWSFYFLKVEMKCNVEYQFGSLWMNGSIINWKWRAVWTLYVKLCTYRYYFLRYGQTMYQEDCQMEISTGCHPTQFTSSDAQFGSQEQVSYLISRIPSLLNRYSLMDVKLGRTLPHLSELCYCL